MNNKGQMGLAIISAIFVFIVGIMAVNFLIPEISTARVELNCANPNAISDGTKLLCLAVDVGIPYWIIVILSASVGIIIARLAL